MLNKCVLVVSDLHCGSVYGLLPEGFESSAGVPISQNSLQKHMWACWLDLCVRVKAQRERIVAVVVNGDVIDGAQQAQHGTELCLPILLDQERAAVQCLNLLKDFVGDQATWLFTQGTEYHECKGARAAENVAERVGCAPHGTLANGIGVLTRDFLDLEIDGVVMNFAHHVGVAQGFYRATAIDREGQWSALAGKDGKVPKADACIRSHCHYFVHVEHASKHIAITPCWQGQTRFMRKNSVYRMMPDIGALFVWFDGDLKKRGEDPIVVRKVLYPLPAVRTTKL